eukprot:764474-Hanusia_phi.AAC.1
MRRLALCSRCSSRTSSVMPSPTLSTLGGRPSLPWTSSTPSSARDVPFTVSADKSAVGKLELHWCYLTPKGLALVRLNADSISAQPLPAYC